MRPIIPISCALAAVIVLSFARAGTPMYGWKRFAGAVYLIHGGSLADRQVATAQDRKLSIVIDGQPAREVFNSIGPDLELTCSGERGDRRRSKKGISCSYTAMDEGTKDGPFRCWIGLDLRTGESSGTVSC